MATIDNHGRDVACLFSGFIDVGVDYVEGIVFAASVDVMCELDRYVVRVHVVVVELCRCRVSCVALGWVFADAWIQLKITADVSVEAH